MTNYDRAVQAIYGEANKMWERGEILTVAGEAERLANALAQAGLLAPDLPEPRHFPDTGEYEWYMKDGYVSLEAGYVGLEDGIIHVIHDETDDDREPAALNPDHCELRFADTTKARETAYSILAACDHKDTNDD